MNRTPINCCHGMLLVPCYVSRGCNSAREVLQKAVTTHPFRVQITIIGVPHHSDGVVSVSWTFWQLQTRQASQHTCHGRHIFTDKFPAVQSVEPIPLLLLEPMAANAAMMLSGCHSPILSCVKQVAFQNS